MTGLITGEYVLAGTSSYLASPVTVAGDYTLTAVWLRVRRTASPAGMFSAQVWSSSASKPNELVAESAAISTADLPLAAQLVEFPLLVPLALTASDPMYVGCHATVGSVSYWGYITSSHTTWQSSAGSSWIQNSLVRDFVWQMWGY
jgi:hypothetical protein